MKYLIYICFFLIIFGSIFLSIKYFTHLKKDIIFKLLSRKLLQIQGYFGQEIFFSSYGLEALIKSNVHNIILNQSTEKAFIYLEQKKYFYEIAILKAFINPCNSVEYFEKAIQKCPKNYLLFAELAKLYLINKQFDYAERIIEKIDIKKANIYTKAVIHYIQSVIATSAGDLLWASKEASSALKLFKKKQAYFEVATTYLHIGTIYRISAVSDVAQCMFEAAKEIFMKMKIDILQAISLANLGMLTAGQNRYEEAEGYFSQALELNQKINNICGKAEILNQQALMETTRENYGEAKKLVSKAKNLHRKIKNDIGEALSWDILSYINLGQKEYSQLINSTQKAIVIYEKNQNISALYEMKYMQASAYFNLQNLSQAEEILRQIINNANEHNSCFHIANAYNLLGLIFLKKNNLQKAKAFFQQAVQLEEKNNRLNGAAVDYANLALIEQKYGNKEQAQKILEMAFKYAQDYGDENLIKQIQEQLIVF